MFWDFGSLQQKHRESAGLRVVCVVVDQMVGDRRPPAASILGVEVVYFLRQPSLPGPPTGPEHSDASWCGRCTRWQVVYFQTGSFSRVCSGTSVRSTRGVAASFLTRCRGSRISRLCRCGDFGFVSRHKPAEHRIPDVSAVPTLRRLLSRPVAVGVSFSLKDVAASQYVCSRGADNVSSHFALGTGVRYTMTVVLSLEKWVLTLACTVPIVFSPRASRGCLFSRLGTGSS